MHILPTFHIFFQLVYKDNHKIISPHMMLEVIFKLLIGSILSLKVSA